MKRLIGYISVVLSMFLALLIALVPSFSGVSGTGDYESMHQYVYKISEKSLDVSNGGTSDDGNISDDEKQSRLDDAVEIFKARLDAADITSYSLETSGLDTIKVTFKVDNALYDDVSSFLNFSWSFMASTYTGDPAVGQDASQIVSNTGNDNFFDEGNARIEYRDNYPYVVIPLKDPEAFKQVFVAARDAESESEPSGEEGEVQETAKENKIYILNNWLTGLTIESLIDENKNVFVQDIEIRDHILFEFDATNPSSFYWDYDGSLSSDDQENQVYKEIYFGGYNLMNKDSDSSIYGSTETDRVLAYKKANIWCNKFNSETFNFDITLINVNGDNNFEVVVPPFNDYLVFMNKVNWSNGLLIATLIGFVVISLFLVLGNGLNGVTAMLNMVAIFISSIGLFNSFGSEFNLGAILGLLSLVMISIFSSTIYFKKIKDEVYLGKNLRKAYQDGSKKSFMTQVDISAITLILGITSYLIPNSIMISFGSLLIIGSILNIILNGILLRALSWLLYNSSTIQNKPSILMLDKKYIPNLSQDEKPTYFDQYKTESNKKGRKVVLIVNTVLLVASIVGLTTFQLVRGNIYNSNSNVTGSEVVIRIDERNVYDDDSLTITNYKNSINEVFTTRIYKDTDTLLVDNPNITNYNYQYKNNDVINKEYYFVVDLEGEYNLEDTVYRKLTSGEFVESTLEEAINIEIMNTVSASDISINTVNNVNNDSNNYYALIYSLIGIAVVSVYMLFRFNLSKAIASILVVGTGLTITVGLFSLVNGNFVSLITLGTLLLTLLSYILLVIYYNKEKEIYKEKRNEMQDFAIRRREYDYSNNGYYMYIMNSTLLTAFSVISLFFANGIDRYLLILILVGMVITLFLTKFVSLDIEIFLSKQFIRISSGIKNKVQNTRKNKKKDKKSNDDGPEEAIFVGIND